MVSLLARGIIEDDTDRKDKGKTMDIRRIGVGAAMWFAGIIVPVLQHSLLLMAAANASRRDVSIENFYWASVNNFFKLPSIIWIYLGFMWIVGAGLILTGIARKP